MIEDDQRVIVDDHTLDEAVSRLGLGAAPIGHLLLTRAPSRWVRFHFFKSKRHPQSVEDDAVIFDKFTAIGDHLFTPNQPITVCVWNVWTDVEDRDHYKCQCRDTFWSPMAWRERLLDMAHFQTNSFMLLSRDNCVALSCYDGGFDVFTRTTAHRDLLRVEFSEWLSERHDGL
jgi:hypothetical protein